MMTRGVLSHRERKRRSLNLEELYERHGENLYRYLVFRLGSAEDAEDVLQEAFCRFARYDLRWRLVRNHAGLRFQGRPQRGQPLPQAQARPARGGEDDRGGRGGRFTAAFAAPKSPSLALLLRQAGELPGGTEGGRLLESLRRSDLQGDRLGLRRVGQHRGQPLPLRDRKAPGGRRGEAVRDDRRNAPSSGPSDIERELGRLVPAPAPPGLRGRVLRSRSRVRANAALTPRMRTMAVVCSALIVAVLGDRSARRQARDGPPGGSARRPGDSGADGARIRPSLGRARRGRGGYR